ncbi:MAG: hypothetical protein IPJ54_00020 [Saprospiraceae bacterium]|nr:hypothetical protein [Saprospiraceae bacterium]
MNRIGDLGFLLGAMLMAYHFGSLSFADVFPQLSQFSDTGVLTTISILFLSRQWEKVRNYPCLPGSPMPWQVDPCFCPHPRRYYGYRRGSICWLVQAPCMYWAPSALDLVFIQGLQPLCWLL